MHSLRQEGIQASMLVLEKLTDDPFVQRAAGSLRAKIPFLYERLGIFLANGLNRSTLFQADTASAGLPLWRHPAIKEADVVCLNWVNQGMLSLRDIRKISELGKPIVWTMHDMWCATGICHHAGTCEAYHTACGRCPLLGSRKHLRDLAHRTQVRKKCLYLHSQISFVAVSNWLKDCCRKSSLMRYADISVIPNAFPLKPYQEPKEPTSERINIVMAAARLDDPIKGLPLLRGALGIIARDEPQTAERLHISFCGSLHDPHALDSIPVAHTNLGTVRGDEMEAVYRDSLIVVSPSTYETLPGTLVEGQAYGALPVAFNHGGQPDIVENGVTGFLADFGNTDEQSHHNFAQSLLQAVKTTRNTPRAELTRRLYESVSSRFSAQSVANDYIKLFKSLVPAAGQ
jgi:glycosyltransferase involved in cell wall biosynthesis